MEVLRRMRGQHPDVPVLFLTARDSVEDRVAGLTAGGDDYVTKPFCLEEVVARLRGLMRRAGARPAATTSVLTVGDLSLDEDSHEVRRGGEEITLTATEFELLRFLMRNPRRVLSKAQILDRVWNYDFGGQANVVELYISYLRKKIDAGREPMIHTMRGAGYVLKPVIMKRGSRLADLAAGRHDRRAGGCWSSVLVGDGDHARDAQLPHRPARPRRCRRASMSARPLRDPGASCGPTTAHFGVRRRRHGRAAVASRYPGTERRRWSRIGRRTRDGRVAAPATAGTSDGRHAGRRVPADGQSTRCQLEESARYRVVARTGRDGVVGRAACRPSDVDDAGRQPDLAGRCCSRCSASWSAAGVGRRCLVRRQLRPLREVAATAHDGGRPAAGQRRDRRSTARVPERLTDERTEVGQVGAALNTLLVHVESLARRSGTAASSRCGSSSPTPRTSCARR